MDGSNELNVYMKERLYNFCDGIGGKCQPNESQKLMKTDFFYVSRFVEQIFLCEQIF